MLEYIIAFNEQNLEVIGLDSVLPIEVGISSVIVRDTVTDACFVYTDNFQNGDIVETVSRENIEQANETGHLTLLPKPLAFKPNQRVMYIKENAVAEICDTPELYLQSKGYSPVNFFKDGCNYFLLFGEYDGLLAFSDELAGKFLGKADLYLREFISGKNQNSAKEAERLSDYGIVSAKSPALKWKAYLSKAATFLVQEKSTELINLYEFGISMEFKIEITRQQFDNLVHEFVKDLDGQSAEIVT